MPVFHTKTIQSILDPVAQQVSQLVILHEDVKEGKLVADIVEPVKIVSAAVVNLITVGKQTVESSKDELLKKDMPPSFVTVEDACRALKEAADGLNADQSSQHHHALLLEGARGILQGVSQLLLVFDQSEVRKIVRACEGIIEYIKVAEVVQSMEELVTFTKNLSPGMTSMLKQVDGRMEDLTNPSHADILSAESDQVKRALPLLLSSMKAFVTLKREQRKGAAEAQENRNYIMLAMSESIQEIIRVLQLTSPTEEQGAFAAEQGVDQAGLPGGMLPGSLAARVYQAKELVSRTGR
jgi:vinculin